MVDDWLNERYKVAKAMTDHGGGFVSRLGEALFHADNRNARNIKKTWPKEWQTYLELYDTLAEEGIYQVIE